MDLLHALRRLLRKRSGNTLSRQMSYKDLLELVEEAIVELGGDPQRYDE